MLVRDTLADGTEVVTEWENIYKLFVYNLWRYPFKRIEYLNIDNKESVTCKCRGVVKLNILLTLYKDFFFFFPISSSPFYEHFA